MPGAEAVESQQPEVSEQLLALIIKLKRKFGDRVKIEYTSE
jgi:hypothetical protein